MTSVFSRLNSTAVVVAFAWALTALTGWVESSRHFEPLGSDALTYVRWAEALNQGHGLGLQPDAGYYPDFWPPGFIYFLSWFLRVFGKNWQVYALVGATFAAISTFCVVRLGTRCGLGRLAPVAGLTLTIMGSQLVNAMVVGPDFPAMTAFLVGVLLLVVALERGSLLLGALSGVALGVASLTRPNHLLFPCLLLVILALRRRTIRDLPGKTWACVAVALLTTFVTVAPWIVRNYNVTGRLRPITSSSDINFIIGNNPFANGTYRNWTAEEEEEMARMGLKVPGYWCCHIPPGPVLQYNLRHPGFVARNTVNKLYYLLVAEEMQPDPLFLYDTTWYSRSAHAVFWLIVLAGAVRFWIDGGVARLAIVSVLVYGIFSVLPFFTLARYRITFAAAACILFWAGGRWLAGRSHFAVHREPAVIHRKP